MMGGFYIRFNAHLSSDEFQTLINKAKLRIVEVEKDGEDFIAYILLVGRHWWVGVRITTIETTDYESFYICESEKEVFCMKELEEDLKPKWLFPHKNCYSVDAVIAPEVFNQNRFTIRWRCKELVKYAVFNVEINTNYIDQHDVEVLKIVARRVAGLDVSDTVRPM
jgi:hypothetical protein